MSIELLNELKSHAQYLTEEEKLQLADFLIKGATPCASKTNHSLDAEASTQTGRERNQKNINWLKANATQYSNRFVALDSGRLVDSGLTYKEVKDRTNGLGLEKLLIAYVPDPNQEYFGGW